MERWLMLFLGGCSKTDSRRDKGGGGRTEENRWSWVNKESRRTNRSEELRTVSPLDLLPDLRNTFAPRLRFAIVLDE